MRSIMKTPLAVLAATTLLSGAALADAHGALPDDLVDSDDDEDADDDRVAQGTADDEDADDGRVAQGEDDE